MKLLFKSVIILLILRSEGVLSQSPDTTSHHISSGEMVYTPVDHKLNNNIYISGSIGLLYLSKSINYERMVSVIGKSKSSTLYLRGTFGQWEAWGAGGTGGLIALNMVFSERPGHFEAGLGFMILHSRVISHEVAPEEIKTYGENWYYSPNINAGYRYQHPAKHFFFRVGLAYPEGAYAGIGIHF